MHYVNLKHKPTGKMVSVLRMRMLDHGEAQFFACVADTWQWVNTTEFGGPSESDVCEHERWSLEVVHEELSEAAQVIASCVSSAKRFDFFRLASP